MEAEGQGLLELILKHLAWYPSMELRDVYKLLYQGSLGPEHMIESPKAFRRQLHLEFSRLIPDESQPLLEPIDCNGVLFRLNLRAYKSGQLNIHLLYKPLLNSATATPANKDSLIHTWAVFVRLCETGALANFALPAVYEFGYWLDVSDFPSVHHSDAYRREYQPAYRLIAKQYVPEIEAAAKK